MDIRDAEFRRRRMLRLLQPDWKRLCSEGRLAWTCPDRPLVGRLGVRANLTQSCPAALAACAYHRRESGADAAREIAAWVGSMVHPRAGGPAWARVTARELGLLPRRVSAQPLSGQRWPQPSDRARGELTDSVLRRGTDRAIEGRQRGVSSCSSSPARRRARLSAGNPRLEFVIPNVRLRPPPLRERRWATSIGPLIRGLTRAAKIIAT